jgi:hypothetical protein
MHGGASVDIMVILIAVRCYAQILSYRSKQSPLNTSSSGATSSGRKAVVIDVANFRLHPTQLLLSAALLPGYSCTLPPSDEVRDAINRKNGTEMKEVM